MALFDFYFIKEALNIESGSAWFKPEIIVPSVIAIVTFIGGYFLSRYSDKKKEKSRLESIEKFVFESIKILKEKIEKQVKLFNEFSEKVLDVSSDLGDLGKVNMNLKSLKNISEVDYFKTFVDNKQTDNVEENTKSLFNLIGSIDFIIESRNNAFDQKERYIHIAKENYDLWKDTESKFLKQRVAILNNMDTRPEMINFKQEINIIVSEWVKEQDRTMKSFIESNKKLIKASGPYISTLEEAKELLHLAYLLDEIYGRMEDASKTFSPKFKLIAENIEGAYKDIENAKEVLSKSKFKKTFEINQ